LSWKKSSGLPRKLKRNVGESHNTGGAVGNGRGLTGRDRPRECGCVQSVRSAACEGEDWSEGKGRNGKSADKTLGRKACRRTASADVGTRPSPRMRTQSQPDLAPT